MKIKYQYIIISLIFILVYSCKKETIPVNNGDMNYEYFPNDTNTWVIYDVRSIIFDIPSNINDTFYYQIKEIIESKYIDDEGRETMRIERYIKNKDSILPYDSLEWEIKDVWTANLKQNSAEKVEENVRYVKLLFPIKGDKEWNGNAYNIKEPEEYKYMNVFIQKQINGITFPETVTVLQKDNYNLIEDEYAIEIYAKNIGMIYKEQRFLETNIDGSIKTGTELIMEVNSYSGQ